MSLPFREPSVWNYCDKPVISTPYSSPSAGRLIAGIAAYVTYLDPKINVVFVGIETYEHERSAVIQALVDQEFKGEDLSENKIAKIHSRHMVGGRNPVADERLFHFEFSERPGALMNFFNKFWFGQTSPNHFDIDLRVICSSPENNHALLSSLYSLLPN